MVKTKKTRLQLSIPRIVRLLLATYIIYNTSLVEIGIYIPRFSSILLLVSLVLYMIKDKGIIPLNEIKGYTYFVLFFIYSAVTGFLFATYKSYVINQVFFLFESLIVGFLIIAKENLGEKLQ